MLLFGGHLAAVRRTTQLGSRNGASFGHQRRAVPHQADLRLTVPPIGNRDNQIMSGAIQAPAHIVDQEGHESAAMPPFCVHGPAVRRHLARSRSRPRAARGQTSRSRSFDAGLAYIGDRDAGLPARGRSTSLVCDVTGRGTTSATRSGRERSSPRIRGDDRDVHRTRTRASRGSTVIKHVVNDNGGTTRRDFTMTSAPPTPLASFAGAEAPGTPSTLDAGSYVGERDRWPAGYTRRIGLRRLHRHGRRSARRRPARSPTTTIAPKLTVIKHVVNDNGGTARRGDFTLDVDGADDRPDDVRGRGSPGTTVHARRRRLRGDRGAARRGYARSHSARLQRHDRHRRDEDLHDHQRRPAPRR